MRIQCEVYEPIYDFNSKKYMRFLISPEMAQTVTDVHSRNTHKLFHPKVDNPLDGFVLTVKVPYRYRKVEVKVNGLRGVLSLQKGDVLLVDIEFMGAWNIENYSGFCWKLKEIAL